jgi:Tfp pilus assembly protein PilO
VSAAMNLKDLNNINIEDLKNLDWAEAKDRFLSQPDRVLNVLMVIMTISVLFFVYKNYTRVTKALGKKVSDLQEKSAALDKFNAAQEELNNFMKDVPKEISGDELIEKLSQFAINRNIQILSFSPAKEKSNNYVSLTSVEIHVTSDNYADIILFMRDIENSPYSVRITKWVGFPTTADSVSRGWGGAIIGQGPDNTKKAIEATIEIGSVKFQNA